MHAKKNLKYFIIALGLLFGPFYAGNPDSSAGTAEVVLYFTGDVTMANHFQYHVGTRFEYPFAKIPWFKEGDVSMVNLENPLTNRGTPRPKLFIFRALPEYTRVLKAGGVDIVTLANNHIFDYSEEGLNDTMEHLKKAGIAFVGAGRNLEEARKPVIFRVKGLKLAYLGYYGSKKHSNSQPATEDSAGTAMRKLRFIKEDIKAIRDSVDFISVNLHWGYEKEHYPEETQIQFAHRVIDFGADLVVGHHPHVLQGVEVYKGKTIAYSLGNFIFGGNSRTMERSALLKITLFPDNPVAYQSEMIPIQIDYWQPRLLTNSYKDTVLINLKTYSSFFEQSIF